MRETVSWYGPSYSYANTIVFNNFPWPNLNDESNQDIAKTAQKILDTRNKYPNDSLGDLYSPEPSMPDLIKAHEANDKAVLKAYGLKPNATEEEIVQHLFEIYEKLTNN